MKARLLAPFFLLAVFLISSEAQTGEEFVITVSARQSIDAIHQQHGTRTLRQIPKTSVYLVRAAAAEGGDKLKKLKEDKNIESAERNSRIKLNARTAVSDPVLGEHMASLLDGRTLTEFFGTNVLKSYVEQPAVALTAIDKARSLSTGAATRVAYIDTGVDYYHPALRPWLDPAVDLVLNKSGSELEGLSEHMMTLLDDQMMSLLDDRFMFLLNEGMMSLLDNRPQSQAFPPALGHGTLVAGLIHLVAPNARIVPIRAFDSNGDTTMFTLIEAIYRAKEQNIDVLNMSFSTTENSDAFRKAINSALADGIAVVASAGNDSRSGPELYPVAYPGVVGVAATDLNDRLAAFSNYGKSVSIASPGAFVISTVPGGRYAAAWGTSFSAPIVSGVLALRATSRANRHTDVSAVLNNADFVDHLNPGFEKQLGKGRVNAHRALTRK